MIDPYVLLAPILLLGIIAALGFVGCTFHHGVAPLGISPSSGSTTGGTIVTISDDGTGQIGTLYGSEYSVTFKAPNLDASTISLFADSDSISIQTPPCPDTKDADPTSGDVKVDVKIDYTNNDGHAVSVTQSQAFTYVPPVAHTATVIKVAPAGTAVLTAPPIGLQGNELIVLTVQWGGTDSAPVLTGATFQPIPGVGPPYTWNETAIQTFFAINTVNGQVGITATLSDAPVPWSLCVSAYDHADTSNPFYSPVASDLTYVGLEPTAPTMTAQNPGDLVYAVAFAADGDGTFPGSNQLAPADPQLGWVADSDSTNPLVMELPIAHLSEDVTASAVDNNPGGPGPAWIFAMGIKISM